MLWVCKSTTGSFSQEALPQEEQHTVFRTKNRWLLHATYCMLSQLPLIIMLISICLAEASEENLNVQQVLIEKCF